MNISFCLITPAYNAEATMSKLIESVISQSLQPITWIIVDDGSTDSTAEIIREYQRKYSFIQFEQVQKGKVHSFSAKVNALNLAISKLDFSKAEFIGVLDSDVELPSDYFIDLFKRMLGNRSLGVAGGRYRPYYKGKFYDRPINRGNIPGGIQMFKMLCFQEIGAKFINFPHGGEDSAMLIMARFKGWEVRSFEDLPVIHHGRVGGAAGSYLQTRFKAGLSFACLGYHPLVFTWSCIKKAKRYPWLLGSIYECAGFVLGVIRYPASLLDKETLLFYRQEQLRFLFRKRRIFQRLKKR